MSIVSSLYQMTTLHVAAERGYIKIVDYLVGKGANIDIQDEKGVIICDTFNNNYFLEFELASSNPLPKILLMLCVYNCYLLP